MAKKVYTEEYIQDIANAIRIVNKGTDKYTVAEMANAIKSFSGGLNVTEIDLNIVDCTIS